MRRQAHKLTAETQCIVKILLQCAWILQCIKIVYMLQRTVCCVIAQLITTASEALSQYMYYNIIYNLSDSCLHSTMVTSQMYHSICGVDRISKIYICHINVEVRAYGYLRACVR